MKPKGIKILLAAIFVVGFAFLTGNKAALALPTLQLDIADGVYDSTDETIYATSDQFTLYALLNGLSQKLQDNPALLTDTYRISVALRPITKNPGNFGSFTFGGTTVEVTNDMVFGAPPLESNVLWDSGDLSKHGIYETYYTEFSFNFDLTKTAPVYNSADSPGGPDLTSPGSLYYASFLVDTTNLNPDYTIHFDLYNTTQIEEIKKKGGTITDTDVDLFAPFSHDANSTNSTPVPIPPTMLLFGSGLLGLVGFRRNFRKA